MMLIDKVEGSDLARAMLNRGDKKVWCAVADGSDEEAMSGLTSKDFTDFVVSFSETGFFCSSGVEWAYAVPIKVVTVTEIMEDPLASPIKIVPVLEIEQNLCNCGCSNW